MNHHVEFVDHWIGGLLGPGVWMDEDIDAEAFGKHERDLFSPAGIDPATGKDWGVKWFKALGGPVTGEGNATTKETAGTRPVL